ncbi:hypothetical protein EJB05_47986, partial [Eragrostis curvula]
MPSRRTTRAGFTAAMIQPHAVVPVKIYIFDVTDGALLEGKSKPAFKTVPVSALQSYVITRALFVREPAAGDGHAPLQGGAFLVPCIDTARETSRSRVVRVAEDVKRGARQQPNGVPDSHRLRETTSRTPRLILTNMWVRAALFVFNLPPTTRAPPADDANGAENGERPENPLAERESISPPLDIEEWEQGSPTVGGAVRVGDEAAGTPPAAVVAVGGGWGMGGGVQFGGFSVEEGRRGDGWSGGRRGRHRPRWWSSAAGGVGLGEGGRGLAYASTIAPRKLVPSLLRVYCNIHKQGRSSHKSQSPRN